MYKYYMTVPTNLKVQLIEISEKQFNEKFTKIICDKKVKKIGLTKLYIGNVELYILNGITSLLLAKEFIEK